MKNENTALRVTKGNIDINHIKKTKCFKEITDDLILFLADYVYGILVKKSQKV